MPFAAGNSLFTTRERTFKGCERTFRACERTFKAYEYKNDVEAKNNLSTKQGHRSAML